MAANLTHLYASKVWAMEPTQLQVFMEQLKASEALSSVLTTDSDDLHEDPIFVIDGNVARVFIHGPMLSEVPLLFACFGIEAVDMPKVTQALINLDNDDAIEQVILDIDSPGGEAGVALDALATTIADMSTEVVTEVGDMMASGALWAGVQANSVTGAPMSRIGSIGVYTVMVDTSVAHNEAGIRVVLVNNEGATVKGAGVRGTPVTDAMVADRQQFVNTINDMFVTAVMAGTGLDEEAVRDMNTGQVWFAQDALARGLITSLNRPMPAVGVDNTSTFVGTNPPEHLASAEEYSMSDFTVAEIIAKHPDHADLILAKAKADAGVEEIKACVAIAESEKANADLSARAESAEADAAEKGEQLEASVAKVAELETELAEANDKLANANNLGGVDDPGVIHDDGNSANVASQEDYANMGARAKAAFLANGGQIEAEDSEGDN